MFLSKAVIDTSIEVSLCAYSFSKEILSGIVRFFIYFVIIIFSYLNPGFTSTNRNALM